MFHVKLAQSRLEEEKTGSFMPGSCAVDTRGDRSDAGRIRRVTMQRLPDNAEQAYKCAHCGHMFGTEGKTEKACPQCGFVCGPDRCTLVDASNEGY
jgi:rubrerythrin